MITFFPPRTSLNIIERVIEQLFIFYHNAGCSSPPFTQQKNYHKCAGANSGAVSPYADFNFNPHIEMSLVFLEPMKYTNLLQHCPICQTYSHRIQLVVMALHVFTWKTSVTPDL